MSEEADLQLGQNRPDMMEMGSDPIQQELMSLRRNTFAQDFFGPYLWVNQSSLLENLHRTYGRRDHTLGPTSPLAWPPRSIHQESSINQLADPSIQALAIPGQKSGQLRHRHNPALHYRTEQLTIARGHSQFHGRDLQMILFTKRHSPSHTAAGTTRWFQLDRAHLGRPADSTTASRLAGHARAEPVMLKQKAANLRYEQCKEIHQRSQEQR